MREFEALGEVVEIVAAFLIVIAFCFGYVKWLRTRKR